MTAARGRDVAFAELYRCELDTQVRRATVLLGDPEVASDVVHDVFVRLYQRWDRVADHGPYLHRAVLNACRDASRSALRRQRYLPRLIARGDLTEIEVLWDVLDRLPFNQRAAVVLRFYGGLSEREIAALLDCPTGSVGPWISRALATMRKALR